MNDEAHHIHSLFTSGQRSAQQIVEETLKRVDHHNGQLNAFLSVFHEKALEKAKELDKKRSQNKPLGKLAGIPIGLKDNILVKGEVTTCASKFLEGYRAPYNATVTRLLEEEDAILIGKTNMDEFAMGGSGIHSAYSIAKNPWDLAYTPGGSSSGSSSAVAARLCPIALGSDTGGSIREPAAFTGITGFKPTYGRVSRYGLVAFGSSLDQIGPLTLTAKDAALVMEILGQHCDRDSTSISTPSPRYTVEIDQPIAHTRVGVPWSFLEQLQGEPRQNFEAAIDVLKSLGVEIVDVDLDALKYGIAIYYILAAAEASTNLARFDGIRYGIRSKNAKTLEEIYQLSRAEGFGSEVKNRILLGTFVLSSANQDTYYAKAQKVRTVIIRKMREAFEKCAVIALPVAPGTAFLLEGGVSTPLEEYLQDLYTVGANLAGVPAISIPSGLSANGKPYGLQLMGPQLHDAAVLRYAHAFQKATNYTSLAPSGFGGKR
ncbi:MAG: Asp-tRNA(Asn)/Glu-tRNA(Gln) amidotransferase subunit GatA [Verrucomicrobia bacterium]|nr:Asp-tRNA(Asn)/Glu-tRNA(Gln) amidotransferase subunit GatA [Verrucomicrobiota bacterium]